MTNKFVRFLVIPFWLLIFMEARGQNLCANPGFEQISACPTGQGEISLAFPWVSPGAPTDLFSFCHINGTPAGCNDVGVPVNFAGISTAHGGSVYAGFYTRQDTANRRTYVQEPLVSPMVNGQIYKISAFFRRSGTSRYATNRIGFSFSTAALSQTGSQIIAVTPQAEITTVIADTSSWTPFTSFYEAAGGEAFLTIGNFRTDALTNYFTFSNPASACAKMTNAAFYYVDDVSVTTIVENLSVLGDTVICTGETTSLTGVTNTSGWWSLAPVPTDTLSSVNNAITVTPSSTTVYLWNGIQNTYTVTVTVLSPPMVQLPGDTTICEGSGITLDGYGAGYTYLWSTGDTSSQVTAVDSGAYMITVSNGACIARDTFLLSLYPAPAVNLGNPVSFCTNNNQFPLLDAGTGLSYAWNPTGDTTQVIEAQEAGTYSVIVTHGNGCTRQGFVEVTEQCPETIFIPIAFSPNGDGKNDLFYISGSNIMNFKIQIYNRWGQLLFKSSSLGTGGGWDGKFEGKLVYDGVYTYQLQYDEVKINGKKKPKIKTGYLVVVK